MVNTFDSQPREVYAWWNSLEHPIQEEIMGQYYPDGCDDVDEGFKHLDWKVKLEIYQENALES